MSRIMNYPQARANANTMMPFQYQAPVNGSYATNAPMVPVERGPVSMRNNSHDFFHNQWGVPDDLAQMMQSNPNIQPMDLIAAYKNKALVIPSQHLTAAILNAEASFLSEVAVRMFPTNEFNFESSYREMNQVEFTRIAAGGIPNQQTFTTTTWSDKIQKVALEGEIELQYALDPLLGENEWLFQLSGMASNAMLTIHKTIAHGLTSLAYGNLVGVYVKNSPFDYAKLLMATEDYFGIAARDQVKFLRMIQRFAQSIKGMDLVLMEAGATIYLNELLGESESMTGQKAILDQATGELMWQFTHSKKSVATHKYGDLTLHFAEIPNLRVSMKDDNTDQPLRTSVTLAEVYPPNPNNKATDTIVPRAANLDIEIYQQSKTQGDIVKVSVVDAYNAAFYYGKDGRLSEYAKAFCVEKNQQIIGNEALIPWEYNTLNAARDKDLQDFNVESPYDNDTPNMDYIRGKETIEAMRGWRDRFFGVTYVPSLKLFKLPKRIGDFEQWAIPNSRILQCAKTITAHAASLAHIDFNGMINETHNLLDEIDNEEWSDEYIDALRAVNPVGVSPFKRTSTVFKKAATIAEWKANENGSLNIPPRTGAIRGKMHPAGFGFGGGLQTYAREADSDTSGWREGGLRAKRVVAFWESVADIIEQFIGKSDAIDPALTPPHFQVESRITVLIDSIRHHGAPVFIATGGGGNTFSVTERTTRTRNILAAFTGDDTVADALARLPGNKIPVFQAIISYMETNVIAPYRKSDKAPIKKQLALLAYIAKKLVDAKEEEIAAVNQQLEMFMGGSKDKKVGEAAVAAYNKDVKPLEERGDLNAAIDAFNTERSEGSLLSMARAPLVAGNRIFEATSSLIRPADPYQFYEAPVEVTDKSTPVKWLHRAFTQKPRHERNLATSLASLPYSQIFQQNFGVLNSGSASTTTTTDSRRDIFGESLSKKSGRTSRAMDVSGFLAGGSSFGARDYEELDFEQEYGRGQQRSSERDYDGSAFERSDFSPEKYAKLDAKGRKALDKKMEEFLATNEYFGPWEGRFNYMNKHVHSPIHKVFFKAILLAHNTVDIHTRLASIGLKLVNVLIFRLFIQHTMSSTIVMKSRTSAELAISRVTVYSSMEKRGIITISGGFYLGMIRRNPQDIQMLPYTNPVGFVGGMGTDFLQKPSQFRNKVNEKGSMIALLSPITESNYEYPLHFLGMPTFTRRDNDNAPHNRKWSSCEFAKFVFGDSMLYDAESHIKENKKQHGYSFDVSFCVARGCTRYINPSDASGTFRMIPGTGARGDPSMNCTNAYKTWSGDSIKFPDYTYDHGLRV